MLRGTKRAVKPLNLDISMGIHNRFDIEVRDAKTGELRQKAQAFNVVCDTLWTRLFTPADYFNYILYGSGTGTPSTSDTALFNRVNGFEAANAVTNLDYANGVFSLQKSMQISETTSVGVTITEIGVGYDATHIVTHAMLQDMNGNPITIEKTDTDIITFYATIFVHWSTAGWQNGKIYMLANAETFLSRLAGNGYGGVGSTIIIAPMVGRADQDKYTNKTATMTLNVATKTLTSPVVRWAVGEANTGAGIYGFAVSFSNTNRVAFVISADAFDHATWAITGEAVGTGDGETTDFAAAFPMRSGAKIYVNGVEDATATVEYGMQDRYTVYRRGTASLLDMVDDKKNPICRNYTSPDMIICFDNPALHPVDYFGGSRTNNSVTAAYSDDFETWTPFAIGTHQEAVKARYWKLKSAYGSGSSYNFPILLYTLGSNNNIHFQTPPPAGAVITADYIPDCIPKDENHVFDLSVTITLGAYTGS